MAYSLRAGLRLLVAAVLVVLACAALAYGAQEGQFRLRQICSAYPMAAPLILPPMFAALAWITRAWFPGALGGGVAQTLAALSMPATQARETLLSPRTAAGKTVLTAAAIGCGASLGREGPGVQIGAAIFQALGSAADRRVAQRARDLTLIGAAAGVAATFGTPLAAVVFSCEQLRGGFELRRLLPTLVVAVAAAAFATRLIDDIGLPSVALPITFPLSAWPAVVACGLAGGLLGGGFARALFASLRAATPWLRRAPIGVAAACGLLVALIGIATQGAAYGTGLAEIEHWLSTGQAPAQGYWLAKWLATLASAISALPGGLFSPALAIGGGLGADLSQWLSAAPASVMMILGMVAYQAGASRAPLTATVLVVEMLRAYPLILPALATALLAAWVSKQICSQPLFDGLAQGLLRTAPR